VYVSAEDEKGSIMSGEDGIMSGEEGDMETEEEVVVVERLSWSAENGWEERSRIAWVIVG